MPRRAHPLAHTRPPGAHPKSPLPWRCSVVQDAHTAAEQRVYLVLQARRTNHLAALSLAQLKAATGLTWSSVRRAVAGLTAKLSVSPFGGGRGRANSRVYRVPEYSEVLRARRKVYGEVLICYGRRRRLMTPAEAAKWAIDAIASLVPRVRQIWRRVRVQLGLFVAHEGRPRSETSVHYRPDFRGPPNPHALSGIAVPAAKPSVWETDSGEKPQQKQHFRSELARRVRESAAYGIRVYSPGSAPQDLAPAPQKFAAAIRAFVRSSTCEDAYLARIYAACRQAGPAWTVDDLVDAVCDTARLTSRVETAGYFATVLPRWIARRDRQLAELRAAEAERAAREANRHREWVQGFIDELSAPIDTDLFEPVARRAFLLAELTKFHTAGTVPVELQPTVERLLAAAEEGTA
jgi:hypothetical protein